MKLTKAQRALLERVLDRLDRPHGWCKGTDHKVRTINGKEYHSYCLSGAIFADETATATTRHAVRSAIYEAIKAETGHRQWLPNFNDHKSTKKADVIRVVKRALKEA